MKFDQARLFAKSIVSGNAVLNKKGFTDVIKLLLEHIDYLEGLLYGPPTRRK